MLICHERNCTAPETESGGHQWQSRCSPRALPATQTDSLCTLRQLQLAKAKKHWEELKILQAMLMTTPCLRYVVFARTLSFSLSHTFSLSHSFVLSFSRSLLFYVSSFSHSLHLHVLSLTPMSQCSPSCAAGHVPDRNLSLSLSPYTLDFSRGPRTVGLRRTSFPSPSMSFGVA